MKAEENYHGFVTNAPRNDDQRFLFYQCDHYDIIRSSIPTLPAFTDFNIEMHTLILARGLDPVRADAFWR